MEELVELLQEIKRVLESIDQKFDENVIKNIRENSAKKDDVIRLYRDMLQDKHYFNKTRDQENLERYRTLVRDLELQLSDEKQKNNETKKNSRRTRSKSSL